VAEFVLLLLLRGGSFDTRRFTFAPFLFVVYGYRMQKLAGGAALQTGLEGVLQIPKQIGLQLLAKNARKASEERLAASIKAAEDRAKDSFTQKWLAGRELVSGRVAGLPPNLARVARTKGQRPAAHRRATREHGHPARHGGARSRGHRHGPSRLLRGAAGKGEAARRRLRGAAAHAHVSTGGGGARSDRNAARGLVAVGRGGAEPAAAQPAARN
jgi:hypothetical protein